VRALIRRNSSLIPYSMDRAHVRDLFLRLLGLIFLIAFLSLLAQVDVLFGGRGLLPAADYLQALRPSATWLDTPTVFWINSSDAVLRGAALAGAVLSVVLMLNVAPRYCLIVLWGLYLSFVTIGQDFLSFQWDNLLLESAFFALFITPSGLRPRRAPSPHPLAVFLMLWLVFRLHVESGAAKLLTGDPTWRNLTAMVAYYETAPLPTWIGWYAHQLPLWAHKFCAAFTFVVELAVPLAIWGGRRLRVAAFLFMMAMQVSVILTGNYGFFNYLTMAVCVFVLDDGHLEWAVRRCGFSLARTEARVSRRAHTVALAVLVPVLVSVSVAPFLIFVRPLSGLNQQLIPVRRVLNTFRSVNAYHLFASMTLVRREVVIEGSDDETTWLPYELRYKPGDPNRAPPFVAPHQPRVDFQLWFLLLGGPPHAPYFNALLERLLHAPEVVAPLFSRDPFPATPPKFLRVAFFRYTFTDAATRRATGAWWNRELLGYSRALTAESFPR
jgi:lipase maturation factor 1